MKKFLTWFYYLSKRQLKSVFFLIILLILPISALFLQKLENVSASVNIGIYDDDNSTLSKELEKELLSIDGIIHYSKFTSKSELESAILRGNVQCGYVLCKDFENKISNNDRSNLIETISKPNSSILLLSNELLFANVFEVQGYYEILDDIKNVNIFSNLSDEDYNSLKENYYVYLHNGETFNFTFDSTNGAYIAGDSINALSYIKTPIRVLGAVMIFMAALAGGYTYLKDKKSGFKNAVCFLDISIPVLFCSIVAIISSYMANINDSLIKEIIVMLGYSIIVVLFVFLLTRLIKNSSIYCSTIPIFAIGSLVCCPVFFNLASFIPAMKVISLFFMPTYYVYLYNLIV